MGLTDFNEGKIETLIAMHQPKNVCELGAQNIYTNQMNGKWASEWYAMQNIGDYTCIDINGANGAHTYDLSKPLPPLFRTFDLVTDFGTSEHVDNYYICWLNKFNLCKEGGIIFSENPMTGNWPGHGKHYLGEWFFWKLAQIADLEVIDHGNHAAMHNTTDGWNVWAIYQKTGSEFADLESFNKLPIFST